MYDPQYEISKISDRFEDLDFNESLPDEVAKALAKEPQIRLKMAMGVVYSAIVDLNDTLTSVKAAENIQKDLYEFVASLTMHATELPERAEIINDVTKDDPERAIRMVKTTIVEALANSVIKEADEHKEADECE